MRGLKTALSNAPSQDEIRAAFKKQGQKKSGYSPEDSLQMSVATYLRSQYPHALWFHTPNGGSRNKFEAGKLKGMGVMPGVPDIIIIYYADVICLELKAGKNVLTDTQKEFQRKVTAMGHPYAVCYTLEEAMAFINKYLGSEAVPRRKPVNCNYGLAQIIPTGDGTTR